MRTKICLILLSCLVFAFDSCKKENQSNRNATTPPTASSSPAVATATSNPTPAPPPDANNPAVTAGSPQPATAAPEAAAKGLVDACALITMQEIETVQKEKVAATKGSARTDIGALVASQCFYTLPTFNRSVSFEVTQSNPAQPDPDAIKKFWKERFQDAKDKKKSDKPKLVSGVGEEAYWVGNNKIGVLYVLKNNRIFRISIGGAEEGDVKLAKSKTLAESAVKRL